MELLFANHLSERTPKKRTIDNSTPHNPTPNRPQKVQKLLITLVEQIINSGIVAGIAMFSIWAADLNIGWKPPLIAFGITFLTELRKYRKL